MKKGATLKIWRVYGEELEWYAVVAGEKPEAAHIVPLVGTVTARTEAEAISRVFMRAFRGER